MLVEDNRGDVILTKKALAKIRIANEIIVKKNGQECINYLKNSESENLPDLILLDLNMPIMNGFEVLAALKKDECLSHIPVIVLTSSEAEQDILKSYKSQANSYLTKPIDTKAFINMVISSTEYWLSIAKLPPKMKGNENENISSGGQ